MKQSRRRNNQRRAFTLIEVATSLSVISVLLLGLSSAVMVGSYAIPSTADTGLADQVVIDALNRYRSDLKESIEIKYQSGSGGSEVQLAMKDAGANGSPEKVLYTYSNTAHTLTRKVDYLNDAEVVISGIDSFFISLGTDGSDVNFVHTLLIVSDTIQKTYEIHAALPYKPAVN